MDFQEQIYSLAYLTERKPFWFLPWTTALQTKPANNSNTDPEIQQLSKRAQYSRTGKDEVSALQHTPAGSGARKEGGRLPSVHLLTPAHPSSAPCARSAQGSCARTPTWHSHTWAPPEERCQGPSATAAHQERDQSLKGQRAQADTCYSTTLRRTRAPRRVWRKPPCITIGKEMVGKLFDWNITVNRREN